MTRDELMWEMYQSGLITREELRVYVGQSIEIHTKTVTDTLLLTTEFAETTE